MLCVDESKNNIKMKGRMDVIAREFEVLTGELVQFFGEEPMRKIFEVAVEKAKKEQ